MKIYLRSKPPNKNGTTSLMLEYYYGFEVDSKGKIKHKRKYETLDIKLITKPKNAEERNFNKELIQTANNVLRAKQIEILKSDFDIIPNSKNNINLIDYFSSEIEKKSLKSNSIINYKNVIAHLINFCNPDTTTLKDVDVNFISNFKKHLDNAEISGGRKLKINTKNAYINILKSVISRAYRSELIQSNPFNIIKNYKKEETDRHYLTKEELDKLIKTECQKPVVKRAFLFSCFTGLRFSDIQAIKWNQIVCENGNYKLIFKQKKTGGQEYIKLNDQAVKCLSEKTSSDDLVFRGLYYSYSMGSSMLKWVSKAGINKDITFHAGRHTFATLLLSSGVDLYHVSKLLGHKDIKTTQIYAKIINPKLDEAVDKMPEFKF